MKSQDVDRTQVALTMERLGSKPSSKNPGRDDFLFDVISQFVQRRKELGLSQEDVDHRMGTAERLCSKWECGQRMPTSFNFYCWAQTLDAFLVLFPKKDKCIKEDGNGGYKR